jgi:predicted CoA-substrate-specific enzyme activase
MPARDAHGVRAGDACERMRERMAEMRNVYYLGCDVGSTTSKAVVLAEHDGVADLLSWAIEPCGLSPTETARIVTDRVCERAGIHPSDLAAMASTGYGRQSVDFIRRNASEISCHASGAHFLRPTTRTIIDVGGQDVKAISVSPRGKVIDFVMNDKCAAGTGRFFEMMARVLRVDLQELGEMALRSAQPAQISSTCSVFAESEVISCINKGLDRNDIAGGIHESIARRLSAMVNRVTLEEDLVLTGGCAKNPGLRAALEKMLGVQVHRLPCDPQINGAIGAALVAAGDVRGRSAAPLELGTIESCEAALADATETFSQGGGSNGDR